MASTSLIYWRASLLGWVLAAALALPGVAQAQDYGFAEDWTYRCMDDWESKERICTTELQTLYEDNLFLIYFAHGGNGGRAG